jgi:hypothetical protein
MSNYIQKTDIDNWPAGLSDEEKQARIDRAEGDVERITRDFFYEKDFDLKANGNDKSKLFLPLRLRILSVSFVSLDGEALPEGSWDFNEYSVWRTDDGIFDKGQGNVQVLGKCGWKPTPEEIKKAAIIIVKDMNDSTFYKHFIQGSETLGDYRYDNPAPVYTGILDADRILHRYINRRGMFLC